MRVLVTGGGGQLATDLIEVLAGRPQHTVVAPARGSLDVADRDAVRAAFGEVDPDMVFHTAAWTAVDACESDADRAFSVNALGTRHVAEAARGNGAHVVYLSTDYVFDGFSERPYTEWDEPAPQSVYGRSKLAGEHEMRAQLPGATIVRTGWVCGRHGTNMVKTVLRLVSSGAPLRFVDDQWGCPTFSDDLAAAIYDLAAARRPGLFHVTNQGPTTWYRFARDVIAVAGGDPAIVESIRTDELAPPRPAPRPANSVLDNAVLRLSGIPMLADHHEPLERTVEALVVHH
ncbi:MAG: dTDP-4-dehydrorhamnose reductase [Actinomycetota bacterium]|nr:dTDP-4-dehydrorhamnose reductase [Actinomycetota bacterium]